MSRIVVGVAGGIAAYKACQLVRDLRKAGHDVVVVPTANALNFVGAATWEALSGHPVSASVFEHVDTVAHVAIGQSADLVVVAPATADLLARAASGRADDLLTNVLLTARCPVVMAPAMHTEMWRHAATQANVETLRSRGVIVMDPADGRLTGADSGPGRLPEASDIAQVALGLLGAPESLEAVASRDLTGRRVVVSAGGTHEALDPVRYLGNASSGLMGIALARAAMLRGADVTLVAANVTAPLPSGEALTVVRVTSALELQDAVEAASEEADVVIMAAAVADYRPTQAQASKIKKHGDAGLTLDLVQNPDILAGLAAHKRPGQVVVGFAAETAGSREVLCELGASKLARKGADLLVLNDVSEGAVFGESRNAVIVINADGPVVESAGEKIAVAHRILDAVAASITKEIA